MTDRYPKIVGTLGPSSSDKDTMRKLFLAGMDVARLNFSHGTHEEHKERIITLRELSEELGKPITILMDLQGPKLRIGKLDVDYLPLEPGQEVVLSSIDETPELDDDIIYIPNSKAYNDEIINYTQKEIRKFNVDFSINSNLNIPLSSLQVMIHRILLKYNDAVVIDSEKLKVIYILQNEK